MKELNLCLINIQNQNNNMVWQLKNESAIMRRRSLGLTEDELAERLQDADFREEFGLQYIEEVEE